MRIRSRIPAGTWRAVLVAAAVLLGWGRPAAAGDGVTFGLDGDGRTEQLALVTRHGLPAIRLTLERGRTVWLGVAMPVRRVVAGDLDHDGDIDLIATTDGVELVAWFNHGRGRFSTKIIHPRPHGPVAPHGAALGASTTPASIDFGLGADGALPGADRPVPAIARHLQILYSSPTHQTLVSAACGPRAPPTA
jgi:hypothetical protein